jgi:hypothetical protein
MGGIPFEVEVVLQHHGQPPVIFARLLEERDFTLGRTPTLGGCPVLPYLSQPRALRPDGSPRMDLFAFVLHTRSDVSRFQAGQRVLLEE